MINIKFKPAFTVIEILVSITIISVLTTLLLVISQNFRANAHDSQRISDIHKMQDALERYGTDEGVYPDYLTPGNSLVGPTSGKTYLEKIPTNPTPWAEGACTTGMDYTYATTGHQTYTISFCLATGANGGLAGYKQAFPGVVAASYTPCASESDATFCSRLSQNCGSYTNTDNCGVSRTANCGSCVAPNTCVSGSCTCVADCTGKCQGESDGCGGTCTDSCTAANPINICSAGSCVADTNTVLMLHMNGSDNGTTFTDFSSGGKTVTRSGTVTKTATKEFGTASGYFNGSSYYLSLADSNDWDFGSGNFTIDAWYYGVNQPSVQERHLVSQYGSTVASRAFTLVAYYKYNNIYPFMAFFYDSGQNLHMLIGTSNILATTWYHVAFVRNGNRFSLYVNGVEEAYEVAAVTMQASSQVLRIGSRSDGLANTFVNGYLDEVRVSKGVARWTGNFTPPTREY